MFPVIAHVPQPSVQPGARLSVAGQEDDSVHELGPSDISVTDQAFSAGFPVVYPAKRSAMTELHFWLLIEAWEHFGGVPPGVHWFHWA